MAPKKENSKKEYRNIDQLYNWEKNPRTISDNGLERLKWQIEKLGQYKPLIITEEGEVIGGNMRLRAYREMGITNIWVSVVHPKNESEKLEYALSDNDRIGQYDEELLTQMLPDLDVDMSQFGIDLKDPVLLGDMNVDPTIIPDISLPSGEKSGFSQMTFTVTEEQMETIKNALELSKSLGDFNNTGNENTNGNALARISELFITQHGGD